MTTLAELIAAHCADLGDNYTAIAARLNAPFTTSDSTTTVTGKTRAYTWYHSRTFAFEVECPTAEAIQLRQTTLKVYPRTIEVDATRDTGDVDHAEWYWRVVFDKEFAQRI